MTTGELLAIRKIRAEHAAKYLQDGTTPEELRLLAQARRCPFMTVLDNSKRRRTYRINARLLIDCKAGKFGADWRDRIWIGGEGT